MDFEILQEIIFGGVSESDVASSNYLDEHNYCRNAEHRTEQTLKNSDSVGHDKESSSTVPVSKVSFKISRS